VAYVCTTVCYISHKVGSHSSSRSMDGGKNIIINISLCGLLPRRVVPLGCALIGEWEQKRERKSFAAEIVETRMME